MANIKRIGPAALALVLGLALTLALGAPAWAGEPAFKQYKNIVEADFVKQVVDGKKKAVIIDSRPYRTKYVKGHIPGALSIPFSQFQKNLDKLPSDKNLLLIFYCGGLACPLSHNSAFAAEKLGYTNLAVFAKGFPEWKKTYGLSIAGEAPGGDKPAFKQYKNIVEGPFVREVIDGKKVGLVVDSRPKMKKFNKGHIPGAINIPFSAFDKMAGLLPADKGALLVFYCEGLACPLSHKSAFKAEKLGYKNIVVYAKGYPDWKKLYGEGGALAAAPSDKPAVKKKFKTMPGDDGSIDHAVFQDLAANKADSILLVDVRDSKEFATGTIKGAVNIPTDQLEKKLKAWKPEKPVVYVCGTGARSGEAFYMTKDLRPDLVEVYYLDGELTFNKDGSFALKKSK
jgi:rhodanese-related sulfurtransferase